jgi:hypothetical protein
MRRACMGRRRYTMQFYKWIVKWRVCSLIVEQMLERRIFMDRRCCTGQFEKGMVQYFGHYCKLLNDKVDVKAKDYYEEPART